MSLNSVPVVEYEYDSSSRLLQRVEGGTTTTSRRRYAVYIWDGWDLVREEKSGAVNEVTESRRRYAVYLCPEGEVLAFRRGGDWYYLHGDALSSTQLVTDESGAVVGRYIYGAWGEELIATESVPGLFENRFVGGLGCRRDSATGLVYMRHRWYDCQLQRFISRDPIGFIGGWNMYSYVMGMPTIGTDPSGLTMTVRDSCGKKGRFRELLEELTGYKIDISDSGVVTIKDRSNVNWRGTNGSSRQLLRQMIDSSVVTRFELLGGSSEINFGGVGLLNEIIGKEPKHIHYLDLWDISNASNGLQALDHEMAEAYGIAKQVARYGLPGTLWGDAYPNYYWPNHCTGLGSEDKVNDNQGLPRRRR